MPPHYLERNGAAARLFTIGTREGDAFIVDMAYFGYSLPAELYEYLRDERFILLTWSQNDALMAYQAESSQERGRQFDLLLSRHCWDLQFIIGSLYPQLLDQRDNKTPGLKRVIRALFGYEEEVAVPSDRRARYSTMFLGTAHDWEDPDTGRLYPYPDRNMAYMGRDVDLLPLGMQAAAMHPEIPLPVNDLDYFINFIRLLYIVRDHRMKLIPEH